MQNTTNIPTARLCGFESLTFRCSFRSPWDIICPSLWRNIFTVYIFARVHDVVYVAWVRGVQDLGAPFFLAHI